MVGQGARGSGWRGVPLALLALACVLAALSLASRHPVAPVAVSLGFAGVALLVAWRPPAGWFLLPALLPLMSLAPWTGWTLFDESDLLVLACLAGGFARCAVDPVGRGGSGAAQDRAFVALWWLLAVSLVVGLWRGLADAGLGLAWLKDTEGALFAGHDSVWNTLRVGKSLLWALLLGALMRLQAGRGAVAPWVLRGMVAGLALVCAVTLWERAVYVGLADFSLPYRTSAWFWEMHVGGGAIDAYLAMAVPLAFWAVWTAPSPARWLAAHALLAAAVYTLLTTYSRGVVLAVVIALVFMALGAWRTRCVPALGAAWARRTLALMSAVVAAQAALVLGGGTFMGDRLASTDADLVGRVTHWRSGLGLLRSPADWAAGLGLGRFSAHYSREVPDGAYPGRADWQRDAAGQAHVLLKGPALPGLREGLFALTQRVSVDLGVGQRLRLQARSDGPAELLVRLCERHLLQDGRCQSQRVPVPSAVAGASGWIDITLAGLPATDAPPLSAWRQQVLAVSAPRVGSVVRLDGLTLINADGAQLLQNSGFEAGLAHWLPIAQGQFRPWHIDNLYLDVLIERGLTVLGLLALWVLWAVRGLWPGLRRGSVRAWALAGSIVGMTSLGAVISVTEVPRVALILALALWASGSFREQFGAGPCCNRL